MKKLNWSQIVRTAVIAAVGTPVLYWILVHVFGGSDSATTQTYIIIGIASAIGGTIGEILRQKTFHR